MCGNGRSASIRRRALLAADVEQVTGQGSDSRHGEFDVTFDMTRQCRRLPEMLDVLRAGAPPGIAQPFQGRDTPYSS